MATNEEMQQVLPQSHEIQYRRVAGGGFVSVETSSTGREIIQEVVIPRGGSMVEKVIKDDDGAEVGRYWALVQDMATYKEQQDPHSHLKGLAPGEEFVDPMFQAGTNGEPMSDSMKQKLRRMEAFSELTQNTFAIQRIDPGQAQLRIKDEQFENLRLQYASAQGKFKTKADETYYADHGGFMPLTTYIHKLTKKDGHMLRPLYKGEVGMIGPRVVVLEPGYGEGNTVAVKEDVKKDV